MRGYTLLRIPRPHSLKTLKVPCVCLAHACRKKITVAILATVGYDRYMIPVLIVVATLLLAYLAHALEKDDFR